MSSFAVVISCLLNPDDTQKTAIILDTVNDSSIGLSSIITNHPIANGDIIADHMYNDPDTMSITGSFSLNGSKATIVNKDGFSFQDTQDLFEKIKKDGIMCDIVKVQIDETKEGTQKPRFKLRTNMVLTGITWIERINTLGFTFNFNQALVADIQLITVNPSDSFLPDVTEPKTLNFTDSFFKLEDCTKLVVKQLVDNKLVSNDFLSFMASAGMIFGIAGGIATVIGAAIAAFIVSNPAGWVVGAIAIIGGAIAGIFIRLFQKHKYKVEKFQLYKNQDKNKQEEKRFTDFIESVYAQFEELNTKILVYNITKDEQQECLLSVDGAYYDFLFERSGSANPYSLKIKNMNDNIVGRIVSNVESSPENLNSCGSSEPIMRTKNVDVYLVCPDENKKILTNYYIVCSKIKMKNYMYEIEKIITNAICR